MWKEFEGTYVRNPDGHGQHLAISKEKLLSDGDKVVLYEKKPNLFNRKGTTKTVTIIDGDNAIFNFPHSNEPGVSGGFVTNLGGTTSLGIALENTQMLINRQDVWLMGKKNILKGVMWLDKNGQRLETEIVEAGKSFYYTDPDDASERLARVRERKREEGDEISKHTVVDGVEGLFLVELDFKS